LTRDKGYSYNFPMKRYLPAIFVFLLVISVGLFISTGYIKTLLSQKTIETTEDLGFSKTADAPFVEKPGIGRFPGVAEHNVGSKEFSGYLQNQSARAKLPENYELYVVKEVLNRNEGRVSLMISNVLSEHVFKCTPERTAAFTFINQNFISSGFDFMSTITPGDMVYAKCYKEDCVELGPDCIILKGSYED